LSNSVIKLKGKVDINNLAVAGKILAKILDHLEVAAIPGATGIQLDALSRQLLSQNKCQPAFLNYAPGGHKPFPAALCVSNNSAIVHGLPNDTPLKAGDIVGLDLGLIYQGKYFVDSARTIAVNPINPSSQKMLDVVKHSLALGIAQAKAGNHIGDISHAIQTYVEKQGFSVIRQLVGHGVGFAVHEAPQVPNYGLPDTGELIEEGLVIAIEPMITTGDPTIITSDDGWTVESESGALTAHQEHTIAVTKQGPIVLTSSLNK
jgi:methionyl aminopeptidase